MLVWISPLDVCVLARARRLVKRHGPEVLSKINIHDLCKATDAPGDHELMRLSTSQVFILWMLGGCRDSSGCAMRAPDGNLVCAFWNASQATAKLKGALAAVPRGVTGAVAGVTGGIANSFKERAAMAQAQHDMHAARRNNAFEQVAETESYKSLNDKRKDALAKRYGSDSKGVRQAYYGLKDRVFSSINRKAEIYNQAAAFQKHIVEQFQKKQQAYESCLNKCKHDRDTFAPLPFPQKPTETRIEM